MVKGYKKKPNDDESSANSSAASLYSLRLTWANVLAADRTTVRHDGLHSARADILVSNHATVFGDRPHSAGADISVLLVFVVIGHMALLMLAIEKKKNEKRFFGGFSSSKDLFPTR